MAEPTPQSKADMDPKFEKRLRELAAHALQEYQKRRLGQQVLWFRPTEWNNDLFDPEGMAQPFDRSASNQGFINAVQTPSAPGTTGDLLVTTIQIEYLSCLERAFRARFMTRMRAVPHMLGRKYGNGQQGGTFIQNGIEYIRSTLKQARAKP
jgi:hypothetical protein